MIEQMLNAPIRKTGLSLQRRIDLCNACIASVQSVVEEWVQVGAQIKRGSGVSSVMAEELLTGPLLAVRLLRLLRETFADFIRYGSPRLPMLHPVETYSSMRRRVRVPIFPTRLLEDKWLFPGVSAEAVLLPETPWKTRHGAFLEMTYAPKVDRICAVLGAGNVSSVPFSDTVHKALVLGKQVILKMNPVNAALTFVFQKAFAPLIAVGLLVIVEGDSQLGADLVGHASVDEVHLTGSLATYNRIVWGATQTEQLERKRREDPKLRKPITSELGNVSPWIVAPGKYTARQLRSQARHVAASITNNVGFNCLATRVIVTSSAWGQRDEFLRLVRESMQATPLRNAYYPGAVDRYEQFTGQRVELDQNGSLPWSLLESKSPDLDPILFTEESFAPVCIETKLQSGMGEDFFLKASEFCNHRLMGSLCASITVPNNGSLVHTKQLNECIDRLRYGCVCVNQWSGLAYSLLTPGWGGSPLHNVESIGMGGAQSAESGQGFVHNTYLLDRLEKTVLRGPLVDWIRPVWFPSHRYPLELGRALFDFYATDSVTSAARSKGSSFSSFRKLMQVMKYGAMGTLR
jgi:acyl-CoA reductase-like NAD-dependent aldehyde dehydrogenase